MIKKSLQKLTDLPRNEIKNFIKSFDVLLLDCDGVLWLHETPIPGSPDVVRKLKQLGKKIFLVTNSSRNHRETLEMKTVRLNLKFSKEHILTTAYLAGRHLKNMNFDKKVYIIGTKGLAKELSDSGIKHIGSGPDVLQEDNLDTLINNFRIDPQIAAVVVGFDPHFSYNKLFKASCYINQPNCLFLGTNFDFKSYCGGNLHLPSTGTLIKCVEFASGKQAKLLGKPNTWMGDILVREHNVDLSKAVMVGDTCETDILFGNRCKCRTVLVLSGTSKLENVKKFAKSGKENELNLVPDFYLEKLGDLLPHLE